MDPNLQGAPFSESALLSPGHPPDAALTEEPERRRGMAISPGECATDGRRRSARLRNSAVAGIRRWARPWIGRSGFVRAPASGILVCLSDFFRPGDAAAFRLDAGRCVRLSMRAARLGHAYIHCAAIQQRAAD